MTAREKFERHWEKSYGGDTELWDDEHDEANHKDVARVAYKQGRIDTLEEVYERVYRFINNDTVEWFQGQMEKARASELNEE